MSSPLLIEPTVTALLHRADCILLYRVDHIHSCSYDGREYHIYCVSETAHMTHEEFQHALRAALSFRLSPQHKR